MKVLERNLWRWLKGARQRFKRRLHMERMENSASSGCPDVCGCFNGVQFWIELKTAPKPKKLSTRVKPGIRWSQVHWANHRATAGAVNSIWILLQVGHHRERELFLLPASLGEALLTQGMSLMELRAADVLPFERTILPQDVITTIVSQHS
jgi:hypothetical protein